ncbi:MAG: hypothetical protein FJZ01_18320 [Candidatus Sericytochromatia bacterium]|nr:hypothetical protein [Candidatus Tanganyikabacteria bacterium]
MSGKIDAAPRLRTMGARAVDHHEGHGRATVLPGLGFDTFMPGSCTHVPAPQPVKVDLSGPSRWLADRFAAVMRPPHFLIGMIAFFGGAGLVLTSVSALFGGAGLLVALGMALVGLGLMYWGGRSL